MHHFCTEKTFPDFAENPQTQPAVTCSFKLRRLAAVEVEKAQCHFPTSIGDPRHELPTRAELHGDIEHLCVNLYRESGQGFVNQGDTGFVLVANGQMQNEIVAPLQTELVQLGQKRWWRLDLARYGH